MDYGKNIKYFKSTDTHFYIGLPILVLGGLLILLELFWFYFIPYQMLIGAALAVIGGAIAFIPRSLRTSSKELRDLLLGMTEGYAGEVVESYDLSRQLLPQTPPYVAASYIYEGEGLLFRKGKDDRKWRSSLYSAAAVICTKNGILVSHKTISLIEEMATEKIHEYSYGELDGAEIIDREITLTNGEKVKIARLVFTANGKECLSLPTLHVVAADKLAEDICRLAASAKT